MTTARQIRTYMQFTFPVDPATIQTIPDMDLSYALGATLVEWDSEKQIMSGVAAKWKINDNNTYRFYLRPDGRWSNGKPITASDVKKSFERNMRKHPVDLRSLIQIVDSIECPTELEVDFKLKVPAQESNLLGKLTEANYNVLKISENDGIDLSATTGPFFISKGSKDQLILKKNPYWYRSNAEMADEVVIHRPKVPVLDTQRVLFSDPWPNLTDTSSLISDELLRQYEAKNYTLWKRPFDRIFLLQLSPRRANPEGHALLRYLAHKLDRNAVVAGMSGYALTDQVFPRGYQLHDPSFKRSDGHIQLPAAFQHKPIEIMMTPARVSTQLQENVRKAVFAATGTEPRFISIPLEETRKQKILGHFDLFLGTVGLADPDPDGVMSFYLESEAPIIRHEGSDFLTRLDAARKEKDTDKKLEIMRSIIRSALNEGYILPLFHFSTIGIGRPELDFSQVPASDESVTLSKVRFHATANQRK